MIKYKKGFTLAEVLITLLIIGVVASLVIPALIADTQQAELRTAFKKSISNVSQAFKRISMDNGGSLLERYDISQKVIYDLINYMVATKTCVNQNTPGNCWHNSNSWYDNLGTPLIPVSDYSGMILSDGSFLYVWERDPSCLRAENKSAGPVGSYCLLLLVDVNGFKGPNTISKDIYELIVDRNGKVIPAGSSNGSGSYYNQCGQSTNGWGCAAWVLQGKEY